MFINKTENGENNICGKNVSEFRKQLNISQRELADRLQLIGLDIDKKMPFSALNAVNVLLQT